MYSGTINNNRFLIYFTPLLLLIAVLFIILPWYSLLSLMALLILCLLFLVKSEWGVYFLIFCVLVMGTQPTLAFSRQWSTVGDKIPIFLSIPMGILLLRLVCDRCTNSRYRLVHTSLNPILIFLFFGGAFSLFWVPGFPHSVVQFIIFTYNLILFSLLISFTDTKTVHMRTMWCLILSGIAATIIGHVISNLPLMTYRIPVAKDINLELFILGGRRRLVSLPWSYGELAMILNFAISIALGMIIIEKKRATKIILGMLIIFMFFGLLLTMSKAGMLGFLAMTHFIIFSSTVLKKKLFRNLFILYAGSISLFLIQIMVIASKKTPRILAYGGEAAFSFTTRFSIWGDTLKPFLDSSGFGLGVGTLTHYIPKLIHGHSLYFDTIFDFGFIGLIFVLFAFLYFWKHMVKAIKYQTTHLQVMRLSVISGLISIGVQSLVDFGYNTTQIWLFLGLSIATFRLADKESENLSSGRLGYA